VSGNPDSYPNSSDGTVRGVRRRFRRRPPPTATWQHRADNGRTACAPSRNRRRRWCPLTGQPPSCRTPRRTRPPQRSQCRWPLCGTGSDTDRRCGTVADTCCPQSGQRTVGVQRCPAAQRPADMTVEAAAEGPQRFRPGGGNETGCRTPDRRRSRPVWTPIRPQDDVAAHRAGRRKQRTVNPPIAPARYNFLYASFKAGLRAAAYGGRPRPTAPYRTGTQFTLAAMSGG
jgi:hypothetical protein